MEEREEREPKVGFVRNPNFVRAKGIGAECRAIRNLRKGEGALDHGERGSCSLTGLCICPNPPSIPPLQGGKHTRGIPPSPPLQGGIGHKCQNDKDLGGSSNIYAKRTVSCNEHSKADCVPGVSPAMSTLPPDSL